MMALLVILAGLTLFAVGVLIGYVIGHEDGSNAAYRAVDHWHETRGRTR